MATQTDTVSVTLSADVGSGGTFTASYPDGRTAEDYLGGTAHAIYSASYRTLYAATGEFSVAFGASDITVTINVGIALADGSVLNLALDRAERDDVAGEALADPDTMTRMTIVKAQIGAPILADPNGFIESQDLTAAGVFSVDTTAAAALAAAALAAAADVPRNVVAAWTGTAVLTVTGTDTYGSVVVESSASGTTFAGKKAFATITDVSVSSDVTSLTVGTGDVFGLPVFLADLGDVIAEIMDGTAPTAGTFVVGDTATPTATTGDVRGTLDPNNAANGSRNWEAILAVRSTSYKGAAQYAG